MPFPHPCVLTSFLNEYIYVREVRWNSFLGWLSSLYRDDKQLKTAECIYFNRKFHNSNKFSKLEDWIELLCEFGEEGRSQTLLCGTLHAMRTYCIAKILASEHCTKFQESIQKLADKTTELNGEIHNSIKAKESKKDIDKKLKLYYGNLLKLADLGHEESLITAVRYNLFPSLICPNLETLNNNSFPYINELNENLPLFYHPTYYLIHFDLHHRLYLRERFEDFEKKSQSGLADLKLTPSTNAAVSPALTTLSQTASSLLTNVTSNVTSFFSNSLGYAKPAEQLPPSKPSKTPGLGNGQK